MGFLEKYNLVVILFIIFIMLYFASSSVVIHEENNISKVKEVQKNTNIKIENITYTIMQLSDDNLDEKYNFYNIFYSLIIYCAVIPMVFIFKIVLNLAFLLSIKVPFPYPEFMIPFIKPLIYFLFALPLIILLILIIFAYIQHRNKRREKN